MTGKTHLTGGFAAGALLSWSVSAVPALAARLPQSIDVAGIAVPVIVPGMAAALIASLLPDIDEPQSLIANSPRAVQQRLGKGRKGVDRGARQSAGALLTVLQWITTGLAMLIRVLAGGHRGATHMLLIAAALGVGAYFLGGAIGFPSLWIWFTAGYLSHLILDMMTPSGLPLTWPLSHRSIRILPRPLTITTGTMGDTILRLILIAVGVWLLV
ncbi:metal-dependent hydrolase [bacterium]|nr:metal-dependent hydrolase [bacterium]